jgi:hypothetical protein
MQKLMKQIIVLLTVASLFFYSCSKDSSSTSNPSSSGGSGGVSTTGKGGSLAKFTIVKNHLYAIDNAALNIFDISNSNNIVFKNKVNVGMNIETVFPYGDTLFIASNTGMYIYSLAVPTNPEQKSYVQHFTGCDPVVVKDNFAYLTIHGGTRCGSMINQLQIYNISNLAYPTLMNTIELNNPYGLGIKDSVLFVCDNGVGLRSYSLTNPIFPQQIQITTGENFLDVIPLDSTLVCMLSDGIGYYNMSNPGNIQKLSKVK